jgi:uncharacterized protein YrrD
MLKAYLVFCARWWIMLYKAKELNNYQLNASDGEIGKVKDLYFDDRYWTVRYLVVNTGSWLIERKVLISPYALDRVNADQKQINVDLTTKQIEESPSLEADKPVSRQYENAYYGYYGWPGYWYGPYAWGGYYYPVLPPKLEPFSGKNEGDPDLRSTDEVRGYDLKAKDGDIGHVEDFLIDDKAWAIRYLLIDTRDWLPGKKVLVSPEWVEDIDWIQREVAVDLVRDAVKEAPEYTDKTIIDRDYEESLHRHYNRDGYWIREETVRM